MRTPISRVRRETRVGENAVKTCQGQRETQRGKHTEERDEEARLCGPETQDRFNGYRTVDGLFPIHLSHLHA